MSANATTAAPTGRKRLAQGKERSDAALGHDPQNTSSPERAKESNWREAKLGDILPLKYGKARGPQFGYPRSDTATFGSNGAFGTFDRSLTTRPTLIVGRKGAAGAVHYSPEPCWPIDTAFYTEGEDGIFLPFFRYLLENHQLVALDRSTAIPSLSRDDYNARIVRYPESTDEQRRIVAEIEKQFTRLEAGVAALRRVQAHLKRYRAAVLKAACEGKLVPTEVELTTKNAKSTKTEPASLFASSANSAVKSPGFETGEALLARILTERRNQQSKFGNRKYHEPAAPDKVNLPPLPEGWTWATVEQLAAPEPNSITDGPFGSNLKTEHYMDSGPRVIRLQNIGDGVYVDEEAHISQAHFERLQKHRIFAGDVVIAGFGENPPRSCIIPEALGPAIVKADCIRFKPHSSVMPKYMNAALNCDPVRKRTKGMVHGVGRPRLNLGEIKSIVLPLPPLAEQTRIVAEVERRLSVVEELKAVVTANLQRAVRLRQSILQKAFSGGLA